MQKIKNFFLFGFLISSLSFGADSEPHVNVKLKSASEANTAEVDSNSRLGVKVRGATDNTEIGNTGNRLNISSAQSGTWSTRTQDGLGNDITSTVVNSMRGLDTNPIKYAPSISTTGTIAGIDSTVSFTNLDGMSSVGISVSGTWVGTVTFEGTIDGTNWSAFNGAKFPGGVIASSTTTNGDFRFLVGGLSGFRARRSVATSGTASIAIIQTHGTNPFNISYVRGATDGTLIGNTLDKLKVDATITPTNGSVPTVNSKLRYDDMNVSNGGVARVSSVSGTFVQVYSYTGSGIFLGMVLNIEEKTKWYIRLVADGEEVFGTNGILTGDLIDDAVYDLDDGGSPLSASEGRLGISMEEHDRFVWTAPNSFPIRYLTSLKIFVRRSDASTKKFNAGLAILTKE